MKQRRNARALRGLAALSIVALLVIAQPAGAASIFDYAIFGKVEVNLGPDCKVFDGLIGSDGAIKIGNGSTDGLGITGGGTVGIGVGTTNKVNGPIVGSDDTSVGGGTTIFGNVDVTGDFSTGTTVKIYGNVTATGAVSIAGSAKVLATDPGGSPTGGNVAAGDELTLGPNARIEGSASVGPAATLVGMGGSSRIFGTLTVPGGGPPNPILSLHGTSDVLGGFIDGSVVPSPATYDAPTLPAPASVGALTNLGDLAIAAGATHTLAGGTYLFDSIDMAHDAVLKVTGPVNVYVLGDVTTRIRSKLELDGVDPADVWFETFGNWGAGDVVSWKGVIYASNPDDDPDKGNITWGKNSHFVDASLWAANTVKTANHVYITASPPEQPAQIPPIPEPMTLAAVALGSGALAGYLRRRRSRA
jgi:hypothetical protein